MNRPVAGVGGADSIQQWYADLPIITKILVTCTLLSGVVTSLGFMQPTAFLLDWYLVTKEFHIWRLFSSFVFAGGFGFPFVMHLYILYENSLRYERNPYNTGAGGTSADYLYMVVIGMVLIWSMDYFRPNGFNTQALLYFIMYLWSRKEPEAVLNIFGFKFQSVYLPWVYIAINLLMGGDIVLPLIGIVCGHLVFFAIEVMPGQSNISLVRTPQWCVKIIEMLTARTQPRAHPVASAGERRAWGANVAGAAPAVAPAPMPPQNRYNWGQGRVLGRAN